jgi:amino acid transporter
MHSSPTAPSRRSPVSQALARDRVGTLPVLSFLLAGIAPLTVAAGVITSAYATTGLAGIPAAFLVVGVVLALFVPGYMAMSRSITNAGAFSAFIGRGLGKPAGVAAALMALLAYSCLQIGLYGAIGPAMQAEAQSRLHLSEPWWAWALAAWALTTLLGLARVDVAGKVLGVLTAIEVAVIIIEVTAGLARPAGGHLSWAPLSPGTLGTAGWGTFGVLAVVAGLGFTGFEAAPVLAEETRSPRRTIPAATYLALGFIALIYTASAWAMSAHAGASHVVADAASQGPALMFTMGGATLASIAQVLFITSLLAALLAFHNAVWRYVFSLSREQVLPAVLSRTGASSVPTAASLAQSLTALAVILLFAVQGWPPMSDLFFWGGTTGGLGIIILLALTSLGVIRFFATGDGARSRESGWARLIAPALSAAILTAIIIAAVTHYATLLGVAPGSPAAWLLPASYAAAAAAGLAWAAFLRARHHDVYATLGLGPAAVTGQLTPAPGDWS